MAQDPIVRISSSAHKALRQWSLDNGMKMYEAAEKAVWDLVGREIPVQTAAGAAPKEMTIWGPVERTDPDGTRWIATIEAGLVEEEVLKEIPVGDYVWAPSVETARRKLAAKTIQATPATPPEEDDDWMQDLDPTRRDDAQRGERA